MHGLLLGAKLKGWVIPQFDNIYWDPAGAYAEVWSSAGPVTTVRKQRAEAPLTGQPHFTDCFGWETGSTYVPIQRAEIVSSDGLGTPATAGRVRIYPISGTFASGSRLVFGRGGATGEMLEADDLTATQAWKNQPLVQVGVYKYEGEPVAPLPAVFTRP
jgi:hypothetical protein